MTEKYELGKCAWVVDGRRCQGLANHEPNFPEYEPMITLCGSHRARLMKSIRRTFGIDAPVLRRRENSFVYFLYNEDSSQVKIGMSRRPKKRIKDMSMEAGIQYEVIGIIQTSNQFYEFAAHHEADHLRVMGEWFESTPALLDWIEELLVYHGRVEVTDGAH